MGRHNPGGGIAYIKRQSDPVFDEETVTAIEQTIREERLTPNWKTSREHVAYVKNSHTVPETATAQNPPIKQQPEPLTAEPTKTCSKCGAEMVLRTAKRGPNAGIQFWGCCNFPKCRCIV